MLRWVAVLGPIAILGIFIIFIYRGNWEIDESKIWISALFAAVAWANLIYIIITRPSRSGDDENIFELWLRVKKTELRKRLD